jgi:hypothetical protein
LNSPAARYICRIRFMLPAAETPSVPTPTVTPASRISGYLPIAVAPFASFSDVDGQNATFVSCAASSGISVSLTATPCAMTRFDPSPPRPAIRSTGHTPCFRSLTRASSMLEARW